MISRIIQALAGIIDADKCFVGVCPLDFVSVEHCTIIEQATTSAFEADNETMQEARHMDVNLYLRGDYQARVRAVATALKGEFIIDARTYVEYVNETDLHHYSITIYEKEAV